MQRKADIHYAPKKGHLTVLTEATVWAICLNAPSSKSTHFLIKHQLKIPSVSGRQLIKGNFPFAKKAGAFWKEEAFHPLKWFAAFSFFLCFSCYSEDTHWVSQDNEQKFCLCFTPGNNALRMGCSLRGFCTFEQVLISGTHYSKAITQDKNLTLSKTYRPAYRLPKQNYALNKHTT